ncbi:hypothetical protein K502DRAFT_340224 [Neoconidiobolus thromboides FSU 785]|nr:hypothetical protein K502DRAFT_340224 [Neoconidiobolus thromboides FSU 785]
MNYFYLFLIYTTNIIVSTTNIYGGGCAIQKDSLYYLGGKRYDLSDDTVNDFNKDIFKLDLNYITVKDKFRVLTPKENGLERMFTNILPSNLHDNEIMVYGGRNILTNDSFVTYDIKSNKINLNIRASQWPGTTLNPDTSIYNKDPVYSDQLSTWVRSDIDPDLTVLYGGYLNDTDFKMVHFGGGKVVKYSERSEDWTYQTGRESTGLNLFDHASTIHDGNMYVLGGKGYDHNFLSFDRLLKFDLRNSSWDVITLKGDVPSDSIGHDIKYFDNKLILSGGALDSQLKTLRKVIFSLDLDSNSWTKHEIPGLDTVGYHPCVQMLNNSVMLASFGMRDSSAKELQLIDLKQMKVIDYYSALGDKASNTSSILIWVFIPSLLLILFFGILFLFLLRKRGYIFKKKTNREIKSDLPNDDESLNYTLNEFTPPDWYEDMGQPVKNRTYDLK